MHGHGHASTVGTSMCGRCICSGKLRCRLIQVACGRYHTAVVTSDGELWTAGYNGYGGLGHGDVETRGALKLVTAVPKCCMVACCA